MSDLVGNPEDRFSQNEAHMFCMWLDGYKNFHAKQGMKFILLINAKTPTVFVGVLTFMSRIND